MKVQIYSNGVWDDLYFELPLTASWSDINLAIAKKESPTEDPTNTPWKVVSEASLPSGIRVAEMVADVGDHCVCIIDPNYIENPL